MTAGRHGGLVLWWLDADGMRPVASRDTPMLSQLCAVPAWDVAGSEDRVCFFEPWRDLAPVDAPPAIVGFARRLRAVPVAPGGRHVIYSGQLNVDAPPRRRSFAFVTRVHNLHHPGSLLRRSPAGLDDAEHAAFGLGRRGLSGRARPVAPRARVGHPPLTTRESERRECMRVTRAQERREDATGVPVLGRRRGREKCCRTAGRTPVVSLDCEGVAGAARPPGRPGLPEELLHPTSGCDRQLGRCLPIVGGDQLLCVRISAPVGRRDKPESSAISSRATALISLPATRACMRKAFITVG